MRGSLKQGASRANSYLGTPVTQAPELLDWENVDNYSSSVDLWAIGCVAYRLLFGDYPYRGEGSERLKQIQMANGKNLQIPTDKNKISSEVIPKHFGIIYWGG